MVFLFLRQEQAKPASENRKCALQWVLDRIFGKLCWKLMIPGLKVFPLTQVFVQMLPITRDLLDTAEDRRARGLLSSKGQLHDAIYKFTVVDFHGNGH